MSRQQINYYNKPKNNFERDQQYYQQNCDQSSVQIIKPSQIQELEQKQLNEENIRLKQCYQNLAYPIQKLTKYKNTSKSRYIMNQQNKIRQLIQIFEKNIEKIKKFQSNRINMQQSLLRLREADKQIYFQLGQSKNIKTNRALKVVKQSILKGERRQTISVLFNQIIQ